MKKLIVLLVMVILLLTGCKKKEIIDFSQLQCRNDIYYKVNDDKPFTGQAEEYYKNGQKKLVQNYEKGKLEGEILEWYKNGQKQSEVEFINGNGKKTTWYDSGEIKGELNYKEGKVVGKFISWYKSGKIKQEVNYKDGKRNGKCIEWDENGKIISELNYKEGKLSELVRTKNEDEDKIIVTKNVNELSEIIKVDTALFTAIFTNKGAGLKSFILKNYKDVNKPE